MLTLSEHIKSYEKQTEVDDLRDKFYQSRVDYELGIKKFVLHKVNNCPCCFKNLFTKREGVVKGRTFYSDFEPDELQVLEDMYFITINDDQNLINN